MWDIPSNSFMFGTKNSWLDWGIKVIAYDSFNPSKRDRRLQIPFRDGFYDYGRKYYNERIITLDCATENTKITGKGQMREVIGHMSQPSALRLWDEPDKYYIGELMDRTEWNVLPKYVKQQFVLTMVCHPFAYGEQVGQPIVNGINRINYKGTADTPAMIILRNPNDFEVVNITITTVQKRQILPQI